MNEYFILSIIVAKILLINIYIKFYNNKNTINKYSIIKFLKQKYY